MKTEKEKWDHARGLTSEQRNELISSREAEGKSANILRKVEKVSDDEQKNHGDLSEHHWR